MCFLPLGSYKLLCDSDDCESGKNYGQFFPRIRKFANFSLSSEADKSSTTDPFGVLISFNLLILQMRK